MKQVFACVVLLALFGCETQQIDVGTTHPPVEVIGEADFDQKVLKANGPVLVDFSAEWCPPCQRMKPVLRKLAAEVEGAAAVYEVDIDQSRRLSQFYEIRSIPACLIFHNGREVDRYIGERDLSALKTGLLSQREE